MYSLHHDERRRFEQLTPATLRLLRPAVVVSIHELPAPRHSSSYRSPSLSHKCPRIRTYSCVAHHEQARSSSSSDADIHDVWNDHHVLATSPNCTLLSARLRYACPSVHVSHMDVDNEYHVMHRVRHYTSRNSLKFARRNAAVTTDILIEPVSVRPLNFSMTL